MTRNLALLTDSYKPSHWLQYPPKTETVYSFFESRGGYAPETLFFGLQYWLRTYLANGVSIEDVKEAERLYGAHFQSFGVFNWVGWTKLVERHGGRLPVRIKAVPEGTVAPVGNVLMTVENTDPEFPWVTNYIESLLVQVWYPMAVATKSWRIKNVLYAFLEETGSTVGLSFKLHDFGFRGSTSPESAAIGGCAHLVNFRGSDTIPALVLAQQIYDEPMAGFSIPAAEHSTITAWGRDGELDAYRNMLTQFPSGMIAVVSDSYNIYRACEMWGTELRDHVLAREKGVLVIRPDSGDPEKVLPRVLQILDEKFGAQVNQKGFRVLNPAVRVIQGDGVDEDAVGDICRVLRDARYSIDNIAFGSGGGLLQKVNRDTHKVVFKCSSVTVNGATRDVIKDPVTDPGKRSKAGRFALVDVAGTLTTVPLKELGHRTDRLETVFENGRVTKVQSLAEIRERAWP